MSDAEQSFKACHVHTSEGSFLVVMAPDGPHHEEPLSEWELVLDLTNGQSYYRNKKGKVYPCYYE